MDGSPGPDDLWGKFRSAERGGPAWHPLIDHCTDVACVLEALLGQPTMRRRLARAGGLEDLDRGPGRAALLSRLPAFLVQLAALALHRARETEVRHPAERWVVMFERLLQSGLTTLHGASSLRIWRIRPSCSRPFRKIRLSISGASL